MLGIEKDSGGVMLFGGSANLGESGTGTKASTRSDFAEMVQREDLLSDEETLITCLAAFDRFLSPQLHNLSKSKVVIQDLQDVFLALAHGARVTVLSEHVTTITGTLIPLGFSLRRSSAFCSGA